MTIRWARSGKFRFDPVRYVSNWVWFRNGLCFLLHLPFFDGLGQLGMICNFFSHVKKT